MTLFKRTPRTPEQLRPVFIGSLIAVTANVGVAVALFAYKEVAADIGMVVLSGVFAAVIFATHAYSSRNAR